MPELYVGTCGRIFGALTVTAGTDVNAALATGSVVADAIGIGAVSGDTNLHIGGDAGSTLDLTSTVNLYYTQYSQSRVNGDLTITDASGDIMWLMHSHSSIAGATSITGSGTAAAGVFIMHDYVNFADLTVAVEFNEKLQFSAGTGFDAGATSITCATGTARARVQFGPFAKMTSFALDMTVSALGNAKKKIVTKTQS